MAINPETTDLFVELLPRLFRLSPKLLFPDEGSTTEKWRSHRLHLDRWRKRGIHPSDGMYLMRILAILTKSATPPTMGELSATLGIPLSSATRMADGLVRAHLVKRSADRGDRRIVRLSITDTGREFVELRMSYLRRRIEQLLRHFTTDEQAQLLRLTGKLIDSLETERAKEQGDATI